MSTAGRGQHPALAELVARREKQDLHGLLAEVAVGLRHHTQQQENRRNASTRRLAVDLDLERKVVRTELLVFDAIGCHCGEHYQGDRSSLQQVEGRKGQLASRQELLLLGLRYEWRRPKLLVLRSVQSAAPKECWLHSKSRYEQHRQRQGRRRSVLSKEVGMHRTH